MWPESVGQNARLPGIMGLILLDTFTQESSVTSVITLNELSGEIFMSMLASETLAIIPSRAVNGEKFTTLASH